LLLSIRPRRICSSSAYSYPLLLPVDKDQRP
jgi:hypothetical protein